VVNELYRRINGDPTIVDRIKLIGVGRGNTPFEVRKFREKYQIPFPLVADEDRLISNRWNIRRTPTFLAVALGRNQTPRLLFRHEGHIGDTASFLDRLRGLLDR